MIQHSPARGFSRRGTLLAAATALATPGLARAQGRTVNVGVIVPLSGANAQFGVNSRNGIELVADEINAAGGIEALGGARINLVVADSSSTPTTAARSGSRSRTRASPTRRSRTCPSPTAGSIPRCSRR